MYADRFPQPRLVIFLLAVVWALSCVGWAHAQAIDPQGRLVRAVRFEGLNGTPEQLVQNTVRTAAGQPYDSETIRQDIVRLTFLGRFNTVEAKIEDNGDGSINVVFEVLEQPTLLSVQFKGQTLFDEDELKTQVLLQAGDPVDRSLIDRGALAIERAYADKGYFATSVKFDEQLLKDNRELVYTITEGPRVRISELRYEGNQIYDQDTLDSRVRSEERFWPFISGFMDRTKLDIDVSELRKYYQDRGYLNAKVGRRIDLSDKQNRAIVTFEIEEGQQYTVRQIKVRFTKDGAPTTDQLMSEEQLRYVLGRGLVEGSVYSDERLERSREDVRLWYGELGFINTVIKINRVFDPDQPVVDVVVEIEEGTGPTIVGDVIIIGLTRTDQKVLLRRVRGLEPGRPVRLGGLEQTRDLVKESIWFTKGTITPLGSPEDPVRDFLIEASEKNTGTFSIGAGVDSDLGLFGAISVTQRNFDATDWPESFDEFLAQKSFIGGGQTFNVTLAPGTQNSTYAISLSEPYLFESDYFFDIGLSSVQSVREDFDEGRSTLNTGIGRRLGDIWTGTARVRLEQVDISDIESDAPLDVFAVSGGNTLASVGFTLLRSTTDSNILPSRGKRISLGVDQFGLLTGDYDFTRLNAGYDQFWTLDEDFLGRKNILSLKIDSSYIPQDNSEVPLFERLYAGGRNFRGFGFRGVGPRGIRADTLALGDDPVGGRFLFVTRLQYEQPLYDEIVRWAVFTDQGTVSDEFGFDEWRASVGFGFRFKIDFLGQAPIAIDFGIPLLKEETDETQLISFSVDLPFN